MILIAIWSCLSFNFRVFFPPFRVKFVIHGILWKRHLKVMSANCSINWNQRIELFKQIQEYSLFECFDKENVTKFDNKFFVKLFWSNRWDIGFSYHVVCYHHFCEIQIIRYSSFCENIENGLLIFLSSYVLIIIVRLCKLK